MEESSNNSSPISWSPVRRCDKTLRRSEDEFDRELLLWSLTIILLQVSDDSAKPALGRINYRVDDSQVKLADDATDAGLHWQYGLPSFGEWAVIRQPFRVYSRLFQRREIFTRRFSTSCCSTTSEAVKFSIARMTFDRLQICELSCVSASLTMVVIRFSRATDLCTRNKVLLNAFGKLLIASSSKSLRGSAEWRITRANRFIPKPVNGCLGRCERVELPPLKGCSPYDS